VFAIDKLTRLSQRSLLTIAFALAVIGGLALWSFLIQLDPSYREKSGTASVLVANRYIPRDTPLQAEFFETHSIPKAYLTPGAVTAYSVLISSGHVQFRSTTSIPEGLQLSSRDIRPLNQPNALSTVLGDNRVAVSFGVDPVRGVGGLIQPGDFIDILFSAASPHNGVTPTTHLLFPAVPVIAIGSRWQNSNDAKPVEQADESQTIVITVRLNQLAAVRLAQARENGILSVVLRSPNDSSPEIP
jgi:pilus assembly protein CpaB